jgi:hypothetical protein
MKSLWVCFAEFHQAGAGKDKPPCPSGKNNITKYQDLNRVRDSIGIVSEIWFSVGMRFFDFRRLPRRSYSEDGSQRKSKY